MSGLVLFLVRVPLPDRSVKRCYGEEFAAFGDAPTRSPTCSGRAEGFWRHQFPISASFGNNRRDDNADHIPRCRLLIPNPSQTLVRCPEIMDKGGIYEVSVQLSIGPNALLSRPAPGD